MRLLGTIQPRRIKAALIILAAVAAATLPSAWAMAGANAASTRPVLQKPNIILIVADDLGYGDLGVHGAADVRTPRIDRLAGEGARMTDFYAAHPICAPSRAGLMTGRYQHRFGFEWNPGPRQEQEPAVGVPVDQVMIAERMRAQGYVTGAVGKWHMGYVEEQRPVARGFDTFYGFLAEAMAYVPGGNGSQVMLRGRETVPMPAHTTEAFGTEGAAFVEANRDRPFFLYLAFNAVHAPMQTTDAYRARFAEVADPRRRTYLAMLAAMDDAVGQVIDTVERNGLSDNTLIIFTSDNGAPTWQTTGSNGPLNGVKATLLEGGIRVPTLFRWTGHIVPRRVLETPGIGQDIGATILAAAGAPIDATLDGRNFLPLLTRHGAVPARPLYWRVGTHGAIRSGDWKALRVADDWYLFNLRRDVGERHDLSARQPARLARMRQQWEAWSATLAEPRFVMAQALGAERQQRFRAMIQSYVATGEPGTDPRTLLYGGGPE